MELAVEALEKQKAGIDAEIEALRADLEGTGSRTARKAKSVAATTGRRRPRTQAERKAQSRRMKAYWAARKAEAAGKIAKTKPRANKAPKRPPKA